MKYTHQDRDGLRWRLKGARPVSELADQLAELAKTYSDMEDDRGLKLRPFNVAKKDVTARIKPGFRVGQRVIVDGKYPGVIKRLGLTAAAVSPTPLIWQRRQLGGTWWKTHWAVFPRWPSFRSWWKSAGPLLRVPYVEMVPLAEFNPTNAQAQHADWD